MRNFREITIWQDGIKIAKKVYSLSASLPAQEKYGLSSQICRAAVSIPSNIAEGCSRVVKKILNTFFKSHWVLHSNWRLNL
jgi:four helix bundle protein